MQGDPPNPLALALAQGILACLKCGWSKENGTNTLNADICCEEEQG
ncbi:unnamed protein product, partial [Choristocarpus tenellus]